MPSEQTDAIHMAGCQSLSLFADDQPCFGEARSDVALYACAHSRCLGKSAMSRLPGTYLSHHFNTVQLLKSTTNPLRGFVIGSLINQLCAMALHSSIPKHPRRDFLGFPVAPRRKLDFHHSSPGCSTLVWSLAEPSCLDDDALHPWVFLCSNCTRPQKQNWRLGCTFQRDRYGKRQIDSHLVRNVLFQL